MRLRSLRTSTGKAGVVKQLALLFGLLAVGFAAAKAYGGAFPDGPGGPTISVVNESTVVTDAELQADLPYLQQYLGQVCAAWHCAGTLQITDTPGPRDWVVTVNDSSDVQGAIGYHLATDSRAVAWVSAKTAAKAGLRWPAVFTHELAEMLVDPTASATANTNCDQRYDTDMSVHWTNCTFYAYEICDPVQNEFYKLGPIRVADFVYRSWFESDGHKPFDAGRHLGAPLSLAPRSYLSVYRDGEWKQQDTFIDKERNWDGFGGPMR